MDISSVNSTLIYLHLLVLINQDGELIKLNLISISMCLHNS